MAIVIINSDMSICYMSDEPLSKDEYIEGKLVIENSGKSVEEMLGDIPNVFCVWDPKTMTVEDARLRPELIKDGIPFEDKMRRERNGRLRKVDALVSNPLRWNEMAESDKDKVKKYRQDLLDVPAQTGFPYKIVWPIIPEVIDG